jgi:D-Tyr-tRNAtyr deacylase
MKTIDEIKAWMTQGLLVVVGWFVVDMKNDVKTLLDRTARLEVKAEYEHRLRNEKTADLVNYKGLELVFDRNKQLFRTEKGYTYA